MNKTRKYFLTTIVACYGFIFLFVISGRVVGGMAPEVVEQPVRPTPAELTALEGFTEIRAIGDFAVDIAFGQQFVVDYAPVDDNSGDLKVRVEDDILWLEGLGNQLDNQIAVVKIVMPELEAIRANGLGEISIHGFQEPDVLIHLFYVYRLNITSSVIDNLMIDGKNVDEMYFTDLQTQARQINVSGSARHDHTRIFDQ